MSLWRSSDGLDLRNVHLGASQLLAWQYKKNAVAARRQQHLPGDPTRAFNRFWRFWVLMSPLSMPHADSGCIELVADNRALLWVRLEPETRGYPWLRVEQAERIGDHVFLIAVAEVDPSDPVHTLSARSLPRQAVGRIGE